MSKPIFPIDHIKNTKFEEQEEVSQAIDKDNYIYLPELKLYVAKQRTLLGYTWNKAKQELTASNERMLSPLEFTILLKALRQGNNEMQSLYEDITAVRDPWRGEWLNAHFQDKGDKMHMQYSTFNARGNLEEVTEQLDSNTLMEDKQISLDSWLENPTKQGLPKSSVANGSLHYWYPREDAVAWFGSCAGWAGLNCYWNPGDRSVALGVRRVKKI